MSTKGPARDLASMLAEVAGEVAPLVGRGEVASYIPALARVPADRFGLAVRGVDGVAAQVGDAGQRFSIQSISKVFGLTLAMRLAGDAVWQRVGREPSGDPFNSLVQLEHEGGKPRNPFINAGAICIADLLVSHCEDARRELLDLVSSLCGEEVLFDEEVAASEREWGFRNAALGNFMKSFGNLDNDVDAVLDVYFHQCSIAMSCAQLACASGFLANDGVSVRDAQAVVTPLQARRINALMLTCGMYDAAGEFAFSVGLPGKSGVGGGILAVVPDRLGLCAWSPALGDSGASVAGLRALQLLSARAGLSIF